MGTEKRDWTVDLVRERCGLMAPEEYRKTVPPDLLRARRRTGISTEMMLTAAVTALNGQAVCWTAYDLRYARDQVGEIRRMVYLCNPTCRPRIHPRSRKQGYPPGVRLGDHYPGHVTRRSSSSSSDSPR